jgi:hypothetical protein
VLSERLWRTTHDVGESPYFNPYIALRGLVSIPCGKFCKIGMSATTRSANGRWEILAWRS